jgi:DNA replicative helicase MCM subunit Mcm2 (Cdc46/Mcm family)
VCHALCASLLQAVAKLRFDDTVIRSDVDAAIALMRGSQASIEPELQKRTREDPVSRLYLVRLPLNN